MLWICLGTGVVIVVILIAVACLLKGSEGGAATGGGIDSYPHDNARGPMTDADIESEQESGSWHD